MPYVHKKWYVFNVNKTRADFKTLAEMNRKLNLPSKSIYTFKYKKISKDNKYFELLKPYLDEVKYED